MGPVSARRTCMASTAKRAMSAAWLLDWSSTRLVPATYAAIGVGLIVAVQGEMGPFQNQRPNLVRAPPAYAHFELVYHCDCSVSANYRIP